MSKEVWIVPGYSPLITERCNMNEVSQKMLMRLSHKDNVRFALFCCYQIKETWENRHEDIRCIELVELWLEGKASRQECLATIYTYKPPVAPICAIYTAANDPSAAYANAYSAAYATNTCYSSKNRADLIQEQRTYYNELMYIDDIFEKLVLKGCAI